MDAALICSIFGAQLKRMTPRTILYLRIALGVIAVLFASNIALYVFSFTIPQSFKYFNKLF